MMGGHPRPGARPTLETSMLSLGNISSDVTLNNTTFRRFHENPCDALFNDFKDSMWAAYDVFETIRNFEQFCDDQLSCLQHNIKGIRDHSSLNRIVQLCRTIEAEKSTWRLLHTLYEDRLMKQPKELLAEEAFQDKLADNISPMNLYDLLQLGHKEFRELLLLVTWCESNAADVLQEDATLSNLQGRTIHWENTLKQLSEKTNNNQNLVTSLDPDAVTRECRRLDDQDMENDGRFLQACFSYIRSGQLQRAQDLCAYCGESWRAATFQGGRPFHDPNLKTAKEGDPLYNIEGNKNRYLWKKMCLLLSENPSCSTVERAIYGSLCGNVSASLLSCKSWEDYFWAHCNSAAEQIFDYYLDRKEQLRKLDEQENIDTCLSFNFLPSIVKDLESSENQIIKKESTDPFHVVQKFVALDQPSLAVEYMHNYIGSQNSLNNQVLRFMAHAVLIFAKCGLSFQNYFANGILEAYISSLIDERRLPLVATYTSFLSEDLQIDTYSKFLENIVDANERRFCLATAEDSGLNLRKICIAVVERIKDDFMSSFMDQVTLRLLNSSNSDYMDDDLSNLVASFTSQSENIDENEEKVVDSINWLLFHPAHRADAVLQVNSIARKFLVLGNVKVVKRLFSLLPSDSLSLAKQIWLEDDNTDMESEFPELSIIRENSIREYLCILAYLDAVEAFCEWFEHFHRRVPRTPEPIPIDPGMEISFVEKTTHEQRLKDYEIDLNRWKKILDICMEKTTKSLFNVILFPDGGWCNDKPIENASEDDTDDERIKCLRILRQKYIPLVCTMLLNVLKHTERHKESLQLADLIISEDRKLYKEFSKDQLRILLGHLSQCSTESLSHDKDILGYELEN